MKLTLKKAEDIANKLTNVLVLNIDGTRVDLLSEESLEEMDAFIATTGDSQKKYNVMFNGKIKKHRKNNRDSR